MNDPKSKRNRKFRFMSKKTAIPAIAGFAAFVAVSCFVLTRDVLVFDTVVRKSIYSFRDGGLTFFFKTVTSFGNRETIALICILFLVIPRFRISWGLPLSATALAAAGIQHALKVSFHRARPDLALHLIDQGGYSFPSGHSFSVLIFYGMVIFLCRRYMKNRPAANLLTLLLSCLIFFIGFSRIYLGVHYPTDVLGGWSAGLCVLMVMVSSVQFIQKGKDRNAV
jgi:undecaprenyl-diphosphatase